MEQTYKYIELQATGLPNDKIELRMQSDGVRYINLNKAITDALHEMRLEWVKVAVGDEDGATYLEFVKDKDEFTAPVIDNFRIKLPSQILNTRAVEHIISLLRNPYDGMRIRISEDMIPMPEPTDVDIYPTSKLGEITLIFRDLPTGVAIRYEHNANDSVYGYLDSEGEEVREKVPSGDGEITFPDGATSCTIFLNPEEEYMEGYHVSYTIAPAKKEKAMYKLIIKEDEE